MTDTGEGAKHTVGPYRLTLQDYRSIYYGVRRSLFTKIYGLVNCSIQAAAVQLAIWGALLGAHALFVGPVPTWFAVSSVIVAGVATLVVIFKILNPMLIANYFYGSMSNRGEYVVQLYEDCVRYSLGEFNARAPWRAVDRIVDTKGSILLFLDSTNAIIVPRRFFDSTVAADAFAEFSGARWTQAHKAMNS